MAETAHAGLGSGAGGTGGEHGGGGAQEALGDAKEQAKQQAQEVKEQAQQRAHEVKEQAAGRLKGEVDRRSTDAAERAQAHAQALRLTADQLRRQGQDAPAKAAEQMAERVQRVGSYLQRSDGERILDDVEDFARRNPWAVVAGGIVVGIAASRFLKASSIERSRRRGYGQASDRAALPVPAGAYGGDGLSGAGFGSSGAGLGPTPPATGVGDAFGAGTPPAPGTSRFDRDRDDDPLRPGGGV
jgi:ElaB/YqjD/DUF883 family membrane-anchored ribosome-binding protein